jgi:cytochrome P450
LAATLASDAFETDDLTTPAVNADPWGYFGRLREHDPVHWNPVFKTWIVTRYSDVKSVLRHHELFSSKIPIPPDLAREYPPIDAADWPLADDLVGYRAFIFHDRPEHLAMRQAIHRWFTPRAVERWRASLAERARELIDKCREAGAMEVKRDIATPLPLVTICWMLGVPSEDAQFLYELAARVYPGGTDNQEYGAQRLRIGHEAIRQLREYFTPLIDERARDPKEDLVSLIARGEVAGVFTREDALASIMILMDAGHTTTLNLISKGMLAFIRHPGQWDLLRRDPDNIAPSALEEVLRYDPPLKMVILRFTTREVELSGTVVPVGESVSYVIASANRDPRVFADPDTFAISRSPNPHVAFGGGIHHCLGAALARVSGQETFKALARNFPRLHLEREVEWMIHPVHHMVTELHVGWD